jgi:hypothetical protein
MGPEFISYGFSTEQTLEYVGYAGYSLPVIAIKKCEDPKILGYIK